MRKYILLSLLIALCSIPLANAFQLWQEAPSGAPSPPVIRHPTVTSVTPKQISDDMLRLLQELVSYEPSIQEVREHVIAYNGLENATYSRWHKQSRLKALLPDLNFGQDFSESNNIDLDRGSTSTPDRYIEGPRDLSESWDLSVSWDFADLIWNTSQTSIDSRNKINADLRREFLEETAEIYYLRRKQQLEVLMLSRSSDLEHYTALTLMDALSARLDGLTGGWFLKKLEELYKDWPEFERLWLFPVQS